MEWSFLLPRPDPKYYSNQRASKSSSALPYTSRDPASLSSSSKSLFAPRNAKKQKKSSELDRDRVQGGSSSSTTRGGGEGGRRSEEVTPIYHRHRSGARQCHNPSASHNDDAPLRPEDIPQIVISTVPSLIETPVYIRKKRSAHVHPGIALPASPLPPLPGQYRQNIQNHLQNPHHHHPHHHQPPPLPPSLARRRSTTAIATAVAEPSIKPSEQKRPHPAAAHSNSGTYHSPTDIPSPPPPSAADLVRPPVQPSSGSSSSASLLVDRRLEAQTSIKWRRPRTTDATMCRRTGAATNGSHGSVQTATLNAGHQGRVEPVVDRYRLDDRSDHTRPEAQHSTGAYLQTTQTPGGRQHADTHPPSSTTSKSSTFTPPSAPIVSSLLPSDSILSTNSPRAVNYTESDGQSYVTLSSSPESKQLNHNKSMRAAARSLLFRSFSLKGTNSRTRKSSTPFTSWTTGPTAGAGISESEAMSATKNKLRKPHRPVSPLAFSADETHIPISTSMSLTKAKSISGHIGDVRPPPSSWVGVDGGAPPLPTALNTSTTTTPETDTAPSSASSSAHGHGGGPPYAHSNANTSESTLGPVTPAEGSVLGRSMSAVGMGMGKRWRRWSGSTGVRGGDKDLKEKEQEKEKERHIEVVGVAGEDMERQAAAATLRKRVTSGKLTKSRPGSIDHGHKPFQVNGAETLKMSTITSQTQTQTQQARRAKFTLGSESDMDLPSHLNNSTNTTTAPRPHTLDSPTPRRPTLIRQMQQLDPDEPNGPGRRRWTLASAMTDEAISDEGLVRELERMREVGVWDSRRRRNTNTRKSTEEGHGEQGEEEFWDIDMELEIWQGREGLLERERERALRESPICEPVGFNLGAGAHGPSARGLAPAESTESSSSSSSSSNASQTLPLLTLSAPPPKAAWLSVQRALLVCRELILTEQRYLALMQSLLAGNTAPAPGAYTSQYSSSHTHISSATLGPVAPPLMMHYAEDVVRASSRLLGMMVRTPSVLGVASAFVECEEEMDKAYVRWCGVVGGWFVDSAEMGGDHMSAHGHGGEGGLKKKRSRTTDGYGSNHPANGVSEAEGSNSSCMPPEWANGNNSMLHPISGQTAGGASPPPPMRPVSPLKRTVGTWRKSMPSMSGIGGGSGAEGSIYASTKGSRGAGDTGESGAMVPPPRSSSMIAFGNGTGNGARTERKYTVRELAILPTQRVMRFILLYRDLLLHTPVESPARKVVEKAIEVACRIAERCDRAQGNAAFFGGQRLGSSASASTSANGHRSQTANGQGQGHRQTRASNPAPPVPAARNGSGASHSSRASSKTGTSGASNTGRSRSRPASPTTTVTSSSAASDLTMGSSATGATSIALREAAGGVDGDVVGGKTVAVAGSGIGPTTGMKRSSLSGVSLSLIGSIGFGRSSRAGV